MIIKKKIIPEGTTGPVNLDMLEDTYEFPTYLDEAATQELITQLKAYADQELGGNP
ncbi:MAG: hypothetical protein IKQ22_03895 [Clostridia bacterium]|nr:hypothetical protein [Clostridia bacterium]